MPTIQLYEFEKISSRPTDKTKYEQWEKGGKLGREPSWRYVKDLPDKLDEKDRTLQQELKGEGQEDGKKTGPRLIIDDDREKGMTITATKFIGVARFSDLTIKVQPRFVKPEHVSRFMDFALGRDDVEGIHLYDNKVLFDPSEKEDWLIVMYVRSFVKECKKLIRRGLYKTYETQTDDLTYLRGKLIMKQQMKNDFKKKLAFNCEFEELVTNNKENQICLNVLDLCYPRLENPEQRRGCNTLIKRFSMEVEKTLGEGRTKLQENDFKNIVYNRMNERYKDAHGLAKMIWSNFGISDLYKLEKSGVYSFFVDMADVYEKFLGKLFRKYFSEFEVEEQKTKKAWKIQDEDENEDGTYSIRTDILLKDNGKLKHLVDAKYMEKIKPHDRYEIGFYIHEYDMGEGFALLPYDQRGQQGYQRLVDKTITSEVQGIRIHVKHVDIDDLLLKMEENCDACGRPLSEPTHGNCSSKFKEEIRGFITPSITVLKWWEGLGEEFKVDIET